MSKSIEKIAVLGATGYVGSRLLSSLLSNDFLIRSLSRSTKKLGNRFNGFETRLENLESDLTDQSKLSNQLAGCEVLVYLVHSMRTSGDKYDLVDDQLAINTAKAAKDAGVKRIIYLSGLGNPNEKLSKHLISRHSVEDKLRSTGLPVTVLKAAMIIGSRMRLGSLHL